MKPKILSDIDTLFSETADIPNLLDSKVDKNGSGQVSLDMLAQDAKTAMTGGSVAVVGANAAGMNNLSIDLQKSIGKATPLSRASTKTGYGSSISGGIYASVGHSALEQIFFPVQSGQICYLNGKIGANVSCNIVILDSDNNLLASYDNAINVTKTYANYEIDIPNNGTQLVITTVTTQDTLFNISVVTPINMANILNDPNGIAMRNLSIPIQKAIGAVTPLVRTSTNVGHFSSMNGGSHYSVHDHPSFEQIIYDVQPGQVCYLNGTISSSNACNIIVLDSSGNLLFYDEDALNVTKTYVNYEIDIPANGTQLIITNAVGNDTLATISVLNPQDIPKNGMLKDFSSLNMGIDGDSITSEATRNQWPYYVQLILGLANRHNTARGGARYADYNIVYNSVTYTPQDYNDSNWADYDYINPITSESDAQKMANNCIYSHLSKFFGEVSKGAYPTPDIFVLNMGTNDDVPTEAQITTTCNASIATASIDRSDMAGGLTWAIRRITENYPNCQLFVCTPLLRKGTGDINLYNQSMQKADAIRTICNAYGIPIIDQNADSGFNWLTLDSWTDDGLHPNATGQKKQASFIANELKNKYVVEYV